MATLTTSLTLLLLVAVATANHLQHYEDFQQIMKILSKPRILDRNLYSNKIMKEAGMVKGVQWSNCGQSSDPLQVKSLSISPDPVSLSNPVNASFSAVTSADLNAPIQVELTLKKKILFWIEIPCVDNVGSCTYNDVCQLLSTVTCPPEFENCQCPFKKGMYKLPPTTITIPPVTLPTWLKDGEYQATAKLTTKGQPIGCLHVQLSLTQ